MERTFPLVLFIYHDSVSHIYIETMLMMDFKTVIYVIHHFPIVMKHFVHAIRMPVNSMLHMQWSIQYHWAVSVLLR